jgi:hypothetical protein
MNDYQLAQRDLVCVLLFVDGSRVVIAGNPDMSALLRANNGVIGYILTTDTPKPTPNRKELSF